MQIIEQMEQQRHGVNGGAIGRIGFNGDINSATAIRTVVAVDGEFLMLAGAGIVKASQPNAEYDKTINKACAALVVQSAVRGDRAIES